MSSIRQIIEFFNNSLNVTSKNTAEEAGATRSQKGKLVEDIAEMLILCAWENIGGDKSNISFTPPAGKNKSIEMSVKPEFLSSIYGNEHENSDISRNWKIEEIQDSAYKLKVDKHVYINGKFVLGVECKSYSENAMMKRILVDFYLLKSIYNDLDCCLLQLETQLGGKNASPGSRVFGESTIALMSYFKDVNLDIITLLEGERIVNKPIHENDSRKELKESYVKYAVYKFEQILKKHVAGSQGSTYER